MAVKHVVEYYNQVAEQYKEMQDELMDFQKEVEEHIIEPERLDNYKKMIEPIKNNYMTLSWIMYLLNQPQRKSKEKAYEKRNKKFLKELDKKFNKEGILKENENALKEMRKTK